MSIVTYPLNGITYDADDVQTYLCTRTSGVYSSEDCFDISITDDMEVTIGSGLAWIKNSDFAGKSICMDESATLTISFGAGSYERIDRIILKFDTTANETTLEVLEGTPAASPEGAELEQDETVYELCLYEISIPAGTTELSASMITDTRADEDLCGLMRDGVTTIPTATLQEAAYELIDQLKADIDAVEAGSAYMLSTVYDEKGGAKQVAFEDDISELVEESLPFSLAISEDGDYGYYDTDGEFHSFRNPTGDAETADVLSGKTFSSAELENAIGTMTNNGNVTATISPGESYTIAEGYHGGGGSVIANGATITQISLGKNSSGGYNVSKLTWNVANSISSYENLTSSNFGITAATIRGSLYTDSTYTWQTTVTATLSLSYNASSGILTASGLNNSNLSGSVPYSRAWYSTLTAACYYVSEE